MLPIAAISTTASKQNGGEEFACVLPETSYEDALALAQELERKVRERSIPHETSSAAAVITISVGIATRAAGAMGDVQSLIGLADNLLYQAKHSGRGRVCGGVMSAEVVP